MKTKSELKERCLCLLSPCFRVRGTLGGGVHCCHMSEHPHRGLAQLRGCCRSNRATSLLYASFLQDVHMHDVYTYTVHPCV